MKPCASYKEINKIKNMRLMTCFLVMRMELTAYY